MRVALGVEYDGSAYAGWQSQPHGNTVQDKLEQALRSIAGEAVRVSCAGRTDSGVHALAQVVHFDTHAARPANAWVRGVNACLPDSIAVQWAQQVPPDFHARFSAVARSYRYILLNHPVRPALNHGRCGWFHLPLDLASMQRAAACLQGEHDFSAFRAAECQAKSPVKELYQAEVRRIGDFFVFDFRANAFLHHMVRNLVGALIYVGKGRHPPEWMGEVLQSGDRRLAAPTFSPAGLYLSGVEYPDHWRLPAKGRIIAPLLGPGS